MEPHALDLLQHVEERRLQEKKEKAKQEKSGSSLPTTNPSRTEPSLIWDISFEVVHTFLSTAPDSPQYAQQRKCLDRAIAHAQWWLSNSQEKSEQPQLLPAFILGLALISRCHNDYMQKSLRLLLQTMARCPIPLGCRSALFSLARDTAVLLSHPERKPTNVPFMLMELEFVLCHLVGFAFQSRLSHYKMRHIHEFLVNMQGCLLQSISQLDMDGVEAQPSPSLADGTPKSMLPTVSDYSVFSLHISCLSKLHLIYHVVLRQKIPNPAPLLQNVLSLRQRLNCTGRHSQAASDVIAKHTSLSLLDPFLAQDGLKSTRERSSLEPLPVHHYRSEPLPQELAPRVASQSSGLKPSFDELLFTLELALSIDKTNDALLERVLLLTQATWEYAILEEPDTCYILCDMLCNVGLNGNVSSEGGAMILANEQGSLWQFACSLLERVSEANRRHEDVPDILLYVDICLLRFAKAHKALADLALSLHTSLQDAAKNLLPRFVPRETRASERVLATIRLDVGHSQCDMHRRIALQIGQRHVANSFDRDRPEHAQSIGRTDGTTIADSDTTTNATSQSTSHHMTSQKTRNVKRRHRQSPMSSSTVPGHLRAMILPQLAPLAAQTSPLHKPKPLPMISQSTHTPFNADLASMWREAAAKHSTVHLASAEKAQKQATLPLPLHMKATSLQSEEEQLDDSVPAAQSAILEVLSDASKPLANYQVNALSKLHEVISAEAELQYKQAQDRFQARVQRLTKQERESKEIHRKGRIAAKAAASIARKRIVKEEFQS
eukprot:m.133282 g.133282  ORF g.133282 m.133282 type:complete len:779 (+) comp13942_c0_seq14:624-2960(+)